jgi:hypothetical protein
VSLVLAASVSTGCAMVGSVLSEETQEQNLTVESDSPQIIVETFNGHITVASGGEGSVEVRIRRRGSGNSQSEAEADLAQVHTSVEQSGDRITIAARRLDRPIRLGDSGADFDLVAPPGSTLELRSSNGRIESGNIEGSIVARSFNGAITIRGGDGIDAETTNAPLTVSAASGRLDLRTSNGAIDIVAADEVVVTARTQNGSISFGGGLAEGEHVFHTTNAGISLTLPADAAFSISGTTTNASVRTDFEGLTVGEAALDGSFGDDPETSIRADTTNGVLSVVKGR